MAKTQSQITLTKELPDGLMLVLDGEINHVTAPDLRKQLLALVQQKKPSRLVIDLSAVSYMDTSGVATLIELQKVLHLSNGRLILCSLQPKVHSLFKICNLDPIFDIVADGASAATA